MIKYLAHKKWKKIITKSGLLDVKYYLFAYPDVRTIDIDPTMHYIKFGAQEGRNPSIEFDTNFYLDNHTDIDIHKINPLVHYILHGKKEKRIIKRVIETINDKKSSQKNTKTTTNDTGTPYANTFDFQFTQNNNKSSEYVNYEEKKHIEVDLKLIAYYLPQFHPIPQNDDSWGKGFTEWTNVTKAIPQFYGQYQPRLAGELGYYDLRLKESQKRQIELAKNYGLHGFCYHYYWFDGKKVMDTPLQQVLDNLDLDFPFCINWANENWTKRWDGLDQHIILAQNHTADDDIAFLNAIKPILTDSRYIKVDGKPLLMIYRPNLFPNIKETVKRWRLHAKKIGIGELYLVLTHAFEHLNPKDIGFDAAAEFAPNSFKVNNVTNDYNFFNKNYEGSVYDYESAVNYSLSYKEPKYTKFRSLFPSWDNEARKPGKGTTFVNASPATYSKWLEYILYYTNEHQKKNEKLIFINAWNEWAEGAYLEPDRRYGYAYLEATHNVLKKFDNIKLKLLESTHMQKQDSSTAVILHLHYIDLWDEINEELNNFKEPIDLYVNINNNASLKDIKKIKTAYPSARLYSYENRGRDILPFLQTLEVVLKFQYKYICKIHTKKSLHRVDGDRWRNHLIQSLIGSQERIRQAKDLLDKDAGVVVAKGNIFSYSDWVGSNQVMVNNFAKKANISIGKDFLFPAGSMFWFNPEIFKKLPDHMVSAEFVLENGQIDGTIAHAAERIVGLLCNDCHLKIVEI